MGAGGCRAHDLSDVQHSAAFVIEMGENRAAFAVESAKILQERGRRPASGGKVERPSRANLREALACDARAERDAAGEARRRGLVPDVQAGSPGE